MKDYSQYGEQAAILAHTPATGSLLDLGAFHPTELSNSRALIEHRNYAAVLVDAGPTQVKNLAAFYKDVPRVSVVNALVVPTNAPGQAHLLAVQMTDDAVSTTDAGVHAKWKETALYYGVIHMLPFPAQNFTRYGQGRHFDFINIDVEGQSADIFLDLLNHASPACWCVEHDDRADELVSRAAHYKYREVLRNGTNLVFAR